MLREHEHASSLPPRPPQPSGGKGSVSALTSDINDDGCPKQDMTERSINCTFLLEGSQYFKVMVSAIIFFFYMGTIILLNKKLLYWDP